MAAGAKSNKSLRTFFLGLTIPEYFAENYANELNKVGIYDEKDLTLRSLEKIGVRSTEIQRIMNAIMLGETNQLQQQENFLIDDSGIQSVPRSLFDMTRYI